MIDDDVDLLLAEAKQVADQERLVLHSQLHALQLDKQIPCRCNHSLAMDPNPHLNEENLECSRCDQVATFLLVCETCQWRVCRECVETYGGP